MNRRPYGMRVLQAAAPGLLFNPDLSSERTGALGSWPGSNHGNGVVRSSEGMVREPGSQEGSSAPTLCIPSSVWRGGTQELRRRPFVMFQSCDRADLLVYSSLSLFPNVYLLIVTYLKGRVTEREVSPIHRFKLQMPTTAKAKPGGGQEPGTPSGSPPGRQGSEHCITGKLG